MLLDVALKGISKNLNSGSKDKGKLVLLS